MLFAIKFFSYSTASYQFSKNGPFLISRGLFFHKIDSQQHDNSNFKNKQIIYNYSYLFKFFYYYLNDLPLKI